MADRARDFFKTDIETLRPIRGARTAEWTAMAPRGLSMRASLNRDGTITRAWQSRYTKPAGGAGRVVYGHWPQMSVEDAVAAHKAARALLDAGSDPAVARLDEKRRLDGRATFAVAFTDYIADQQTTLAPKTLKEYERLIRVHAIADLGDLAVADITPTIIKNLLRAERRRFAEREAQRTEAAAKGGRGRKARRGTIVEKLHAALSAFFSWAASADQELITANPVPGKAAMGYQTAKPDPRPLSLDEVAPFWSGVEASGLNWRTQAALKLLLLTGARANEILNVQRRDIHFNGKIVDARGDEEREIGVGFVELRETKGGRPRLVPLTDTSRAIFANLLRETLADPGAFIFPNKKDAERPMLVTSLDRAVARKLPSLKLRQESRAFTPHCLRATTSTLIQQRGFSEATAGLVLGHKQTSVTGRAYTKEQFLPEKYDALRAVEKTILRAIGETPAALDAPAIAGKTAS